MKHTRVPRICRVALLALAVGAASGAAQPVRIESVDPLTQPVPAIEGELAFAAEDASPAQEKIVPALWSLLAKSAELQEVAVIIELRQPVHRRAAPAHSATWDAEQAELSAAIEHCFAVQAAGLVSNLRGLSHVPIVFGTVARRDLETVAALPEVYRIYEDAIVRATRTEGAALIKANTLRTANGATGNGVGVAVVDTGVDANHPEFAGRVVAQGDFTGTTGSGTVDDNGHGTAVAGIVAGASGGMAPQARLWAIKVLKADGQATASSVLDGLNAIYAGRAQAGGLHIVNMSLGGGGPINSDCDAQSPLNAILNALHGAGVAVFAASGNEGFGEGVGHPACHSKTIAVGAVYDANVGTRDFPGICNDASTAADQITCYSNSGVPLDILAPADCARTPSPGGGYNPCFNGTSAATPYAAGVAAQLLSLRPGTSPNSLRSALMTTGRPRTDVNGITRNRIDAVAAFQALAGGGGGSGPCVRDAVTACLVNGRFEVKVTWQTAASSGAGQVMSFNGQRAENADSAFFWFFSATNFEMGLKILNTCSFDSRFWVFLSGLTDQGWTVRVRDTQTGNSKTYSNPVNRLTPTTADTSALPCP